jgi:serine/threonine-protein kinase RsbW
MTATQEPTRVSVVAGPLVSPVLRRVVGMLAARADLPLDRLDEAVLVADLIAARAGEHVAGETVDVEMRPGHRSLTLRLGPLQQGGGRALVNGAAVPGVGNVIEQLTDSLDIERDDRDTCEFLLVSLEFREN